MPKSPFSPFKTMPPRPPSVAIDRLGKMIEPGHLILFHTEEDLIFEVVDVRPVLNPGVPAGMQAMQVILRAEFPVGFLAATPNRGMVIVGESKARIEAKAGNNGQAQEAEAVPLAPSGIVLTDPPKESPDLADLASVAETAAVDMGVCPACNNDGPVGVACTACGDATYRPVGQL